MGKKNTCCPVPGPGDHCSAVAIVSTDERGQMVLLNDLRTKAIINPGIPSSKVSGEKACKISTPVYFRKRRRIQQMHHPSTSIHNHGDRICAMNILCQSI